jgi:tetratricopeptide (TPR) repeat protein
MKSILSFLACLSLFAGHAQVTSIQKTFERAQQEYSSGNYEQSVRLFSDCLSQDPAFVDAYAGRAAARAELRDLPAALTDFSIAVELAPDNYDVRLGRANVFYKLRRYKEARDDYEKLLYLDPGETNTIYFQKTASASGTMQITSAQSDFRPLIFNYIGLAEMNLNNLRSAKIWLDSAIRLRPGEADYLVNRGLVRERLGDPNAKDDFSSALRINPQHGAALAAMSVKASNTEKERLLTEAITSDSTSIVPYLERAYQRMQNGQYREALGDYNVALKLEWRDAEIWLNRGFVREKLNDLTGAYADYTKAISLSEKFTKAWLNRGNLLLKLDRAADAIEDYTVAITYDPQYGAAFYNRAVAHHRLKQNTESCNDIHMANKLGVSIDPRLKQEVCN